VRVWALEHRPNPVEQLGWHIAATALVAEHLLQLALEVGMPGARIAAAEVLLDLDALQPHELTVEVKLDLSKHVFAVSR
jgi:hypothetical protein